MATSLSAKATHTIQVGPKEDPHGYVPHSLNASVGDLIVFEFYPRNHSVVQADWHAPCMPADGDNFFSGVKNDFDEVNGQIVGELPMWNWTVDREEPTFFYCTGADTCIVNGMVGVINPVQRHTNMGIPTQSRPQSPLHALLRPINASEGSNSLPSAGTSSFSQNALSTGATVGITVGSVVFVAISCVLLFLFGRNHVYEQWLLQGRKGSGGSVSSSRNIRPARLVEASTSADVGADGVRSDADGGSTGFPENLSVRGSAPVHEPAAAAGLELGFGSRPGTVSRAGTGTAAGFVSMEHDLPQVPGRSGTFSGFASRYGISAPSVGSQVPAPQQQQPHLIWDRSIQPFHLSGRGGEPAELEANICK
ncbi:hypothetical protein BDW66DRAFT_160637 [Aspergillus desertorum]